MNDFSLISQQKQKSREQNFNSFLSDLEAKYSKKSGKAQRGQRGKKWDLRFYHSTGSVLNVSVVKEPSYSLLYACTNLAFTWYPVFEYLSKCNCIFVLLLLCHFILNLLKTLINSLRDIKFVHISLLVCIKYSIKLQRKCIKQLCISNFVTFVAWLSQCTIVTVKGRERQLVCVCLCVCSKP